MPSQKRPVVDLEGPDAQADQRAAAANPGPQAPSPFLVRRRKSVPQTTSVPAKLEVCIGVYALDGSAVHDCFEEQEKVFLLSMEHRTKPGLLYKARDNLTAYLRQEADNGAPSDLRGLATQCQLLFAFSGPPTWRTCLFAGGGSSGLTAALTLLEAFAQWRRQADPTIQEFTVSLNAPEGIPANGPWRTMSCRYLCL